MGGGLFVSSFTPFDQPHKSYWKVLTRETGTFSLGWSDFLKFKMDPRIALLNCLRIAIQNLAFQVAFLCGTHLIYKKFKLAEFLTAKNEEKLNKIFIFRGEKFLQTSFAKQCFENKPLK